MSSRFIDRLFRSLRVAAAICLVGVLAACGGDSGDAGGSGDGSAVAPKLYIFGDSLSDTGNLGRPLSLGDDLPSPFFNNRISNGPVIVDHVATSLGLTLESSNYLSSQERGTNYAIAGAQAYADGLEIDLAAQVLSFAAKNDGDADANNVYLIFIGGNDVLDAVGAGAQANANLDRAASEVGDAVRDLAILGARRFFVLTVPDIGKTPKLIQENVDIDPGRTARATELTQYFNAGVRAEVNGLRLFGVNINVIDIYSIVNDLITNATAQGYTNTTQACYVTDEFRFSDSCQASDFDSYVFFDQIHPTGKTHRLVGLEVARQINALLN